MKYTLILRIPTINDNIFPSFEEKYKLTKDDLMKLTIKDKKGFKKIDNQ